MTTQATVTQDQASTVLQESCGFAPTGKWHLSDDGTHALCGRQARTPFGWNCRGDREAFDKADLQYRYCKNCVKREDDRTKS